MLENEIKKAIDEYVEHSKLSTGFAKKTIWVSDYMLDNLTDAENEQDELRMRMHYRGIFIRAAVLDYLKFVRKLYDTYGQTDKCKIQLPFTITSQFTDDIEEIADITGISDDSNIVRSALEHVFREWYSEKSNIQSQESTLDKFVKNETVKDSSAINSNQ